MSGIYSIQWQHPADSYFLESYTVSVVDGINPRFLPTQEERTSLRILANPPKEEIQPAYGPVEVGKQLVITSHFNFGTDSFSIKSRKIDVSPSDVGISSLIEIPTTFWLGESVTATRSVGIYKYYLKDLYDEDRIDNGYIFDATTPTKTSVGVYKYYVVAINFNIDDLIDISYATIHLSDPAESEWNINPTFAKNMFQFEMYYGKNWVTRSEIGTIEITQIGSNN